jgi:peptide/nickel transport system substrate-binding protein
MNYKKIACLAFSLAMTASMFAGCASKPAPAPAATGTATATKLVNPGDATPRNQTLYVNGLQWGAPANFNPLAASPAWPIAIGAARNLTYETLFMFNQLDGSLQPLLGSKYAWTDDHTLTVTMNKDAHWNDGKPVTADDVAYTYNLGKKYDVSFKGYWDYLDSVTATDAQTVTLKLSTTNYNRLTVLESLSGLYILPKHIWEALETKDNNSIVDLRKEINDKPVGSGPYKLFFYNDQKITIARDDNYWGKATSEFGKLPAPVYITHNIFKDNASGDTAFKAGEVDVSQQFTPKVWDMWASGAPVKTYLKAAPYYIAGSIPEIIFNTTKKGLDNPVVRKAIAMSIDYKKISDVAMSGYSAAMVPSLNLLTSAEQALIDPSQLTSLQWTTDIAAANKLLDTVSTKGADGIRVLKDGTKLGTWFAECPFGWSDWNASLEIVAQSAKAVGIDIKTKFPESPVWTNDEQNGKFDIIMDTPGGGPSVSQPWARARALMSSLSVPAVGTPAFWDFGRYKNPAADALLAQIPQQTDAAKLKDLYTQLNKIYLTDVPTVGLMYRPALFYTVNESVWTGFPVDGDGSNIPPMICTDAYGIKALYGIKAK